MKREKIHIEYEATLAALTEFSIEYNKRCTERKDRINAGMKGVAERMITLYLGQINGTYLDPEKDLIPGFHTFNPSLAKDRGCAVRTIINIRRRLVQSGLIKIELLNGNDGIYIWFADELFKHNPLYTFMVKRDMQNLHALTSSETHFSGSTMKKLHPLVSHELINKNRNVDKWKTQEFDLLDDERIMNTEKTGWEEIDNLTEESHPSSSLLWMVESFWLRARTKLYPYEEFDKERTRHILNFIWESVYGKFQYNQSEQQWREYHKIALRRIGMVHRWLHRKPNHWVPIAEIYFDPLNRKNGFNKTWDWYLRSAKKKKKRR